MMLTRALYPIPRHAPRRHRAVACCGPHAVRPAHLPLRQPRVRGVLRSRSRRAELELFSRAVLGDRIGDTALETIGGVPYVTFAADGLTERDVAFLANLSSVYALFAREGGLLRPVELHPLDRYDDDLITIPKYGGQDQRAVHQAAAQRDPAVLGLGRRVPGPAVPGAGPALRSRHHAQPAASSVRLDAAGIDRDQGRRGLLVLPAVWRASRQARTARSPAASAEPSSARSAGAPGRCSAAGTPSAASARAGATQEVEVINADTVRAPASTSEHRPSSTWSSRTRRTACSTAAGPRPA